MDICLKKKRRKKWPKLLVTEVFNNSNNPYGVGHCWHCGRKIDIKKRRLQDGKTAWHIDHYPVQYVDIESQVCCGVTDEHEMSNLVPSCVKCNLSHKFERKHWYYCGRSQCYCTKKCYCWLATMLLIVLIVVISI